MTTANQVLKPPALRPGDTIGIVAPASPMWRDLLALGCRTLEEMGYQWKYLDSIFAEELFFAGSAERRAREIESMFEDDSVQAIVCARGGYGSNYLPPLLNLEKLRSHPKIFVGYSDVTTLLNYMTEATGLVTFHGPMIAKDFAAVGGVDVGSWLGALSGESLLDVTLPTTHKLRALQTGEAEGRLCGGCLSMLVSSLGTPYEVQTEGSILLIEDVSVKPYQVDRMLMQWKHAGKLDRVRGLAFGEMLHCEAPPDQKSELRFTLEEVVMRGVGSLGVPVVYGLPFGHVAGAQLTLPIGARVRLSAGVEAIRIQALESSVRRA